MASFTGLFSHFFGSGGFELLLHRDLPLCDSEGSEWPRYQVWLRYVRKQVALVFCLICFVCVYRAPTKIAKHSVTFEKAEMRTNWRTADGIQSQKRMRKQAAATQVNMIPTSFPAQPTLIEPNKGSQPGLSSFL